MLKKILIDRKPNGNKIIIPLDVTHENMDQQVKLFTEIADDNPFDGQLHISHFRLYHSWFAHFPDGNYESSAN